MDFRARLVAEQSPSPTEQHNYKYARQCRTLPRGQEVARRAGRLPGSGVLGRLRSMARGDTVSPPGVSTHITIKRAYLKLPDEFLQRTGF